MPRPADTDGFVSAESSDVCSGFARYHAKSEGIVYKKALAEMIRTVVNRVEPSGVQESVQFDGPMWLFGYVGDET